MNIRSMLVRLQNAMGRNDLVEQMVLLPEPTIPNRELAKSTRSVNLVVGYNRSPSSQTALDVTLWIAHQTRLVTKAQVTVHVVYVVAEHQNSRLLDVYSSAETSTQITEKNSLEFAQATTASSHTPVLSQQGQEVLATYPRTTSIEPCYFRAMFYENEAFEQADQILSQARSLADEWRGSFKAHLRFGSVAEELRKVVQLETAALLLLGCNSITHPIVQQLGNHFPCPVLGIPTTLNSSADDHQDE